jgi:hypothetical protein
VASSAEDFVAKSIETLATTGIEVIKYHYSKMTSETCVLKLSEDKKKLKWEY